MTRRHIRRIVCETVRRVSDARRKVRLSTELRKLPLDSLNFIEVLVTCEETFGIGFTEDELFLRAYTTVRDIYKTCREKMRAKI